MKLQAAALRRYVLVSAVLCCCLVLPARAQRVQPVIAELAGTTQSSLELVNNSMYPLVAVLEPRSFSLSETGRPVFRCRSTGRSGFASRP